MYNIDAEKSVLGCCLLEESAFDAVVSAGISSKDFFSEANRSVFKAIAESAAAGEFIDSVTVAQVLRDMGSYEASGGVEYLDHLISITPNADNAVAYAEIVVEWSGRRRIQAMADTLTEMIREGASKKALISTASDVLSEEVGVGGDSGIHGVKEAVARSLEYIDQKYNSTQSQWSTGLLDLDHLIRPEDSRIYAIIGDTGSGKTTLAQTIAEASLRDGVPVYYVSLEMPVHHMMNRFISSAGNVERGFLKDPKTFKNSDEQMMKIAPALNVIKGYELTIDDSQVQDAETVSARVKGWLRKIRKDDPTRRAMLVVDYLGLMDIPGRDLVNELGEVSKKLKRLTNETGICTLMLAQVNREVSKRPDRRPHKSDIRDSGKIENDMDGIIAVYRDEYYNEDSQDKGIAEILVRKNRDGETGMIKCRANLRYSKFENLSYGYD